MRHDAAEFEIVGETQDLLAINKPAGLLVHPTKPGGPRTLWDGLRDLLGYEIVTGGQVSLVNRLDRETSGLVLVAKTSDAARRAGIAMQEGRIQKRYVSIVTGWPESEKFEVVAPIIRLGEVAPSSIWLLRAVHPSGAPSQTAFEVLARYRRGAERFALVAAEPITGRTHQIRVHLSHIGHPVVGDKIYGPSAECYLEFVKTGWSASLAERLLMSRHALHSARVQLDWSDRRLEWACEIPSDMAGFLASMTLDSAR